MDTELGLIYKVLVLSVSLSILIKYGGMLLSIPSTTVNALIAIFTPVLVIAIALWWRTARVIKKRGEQ